jgi:L-fuconolactonase
VTPRIDAHQHFFDPSRHRYPWTGDGGVLDRSHAPQDLRPLPAEAGMIRTVLVQALASTEETCDLLAIAAHCEMVGAVVGWVDLCAPDVGERIAALRAEVGGDRLRGIRHQACDEADPGWICREDVQRGIAAVGEAGLVYELLLRPEQLDMALDTARRHPGQRFVLGHLGLPPLLGDDAELQPWRTGMRALAEAPNVACKLAGLLTLAGERWRRCDFSRVVAPLLEWFGPSRLCFGSDWPACRLGGGYAEAVEVVEQQVGLLGEAERAAVMGGTAAAVYGIEA